MEQVGGWQLTIDSFVHSLSAVSNIDSNNDSNNNEVLMERVGGGGGGGGAAAAADGSRVPADRDLPADSITIHPACLPACGAAQVDQEGAGAGEGREDGAGAEVSGPLAPLASQLEPPKCPLRLHSRQHALRLPALACLGCKRIRRCPCPLPPTSAPSPPPLPPPPHLCPLPPTTAPSSHPPSHPPLHSTPPYPHPTPLHPTPPYPHPPHPQVS